MKELKLKQFIKQFSRAYFKVQLFSIARLLHLFKLSLGTRAVAVARGENKALLQVSA